MSGEGGAGTAAALHREDGRVESGAGRAACASSPRLCVYGTWPSTPPRGAILRGHVFCSFLALPLRHELEDRLARKGWKLEWADVNP